MAFISIESFSAPFRNKVHLVSICMAAAVFGVFRLSGGGIAIEANSSLLPAVETRAQPVRANTSRTQATRPTSPAPVANKAAPRRAAPARAGDIDSLLAKPKKAAPAPQAPKKSKLDDIEQTLGLR